MIEDMDSSDGVDDALSRGKYYTIFSFLSWSDKHKSIHFVVVRCVLENTQVDGCTKQISLTYRFLDHFTICYQKYI